ncbi:polysaccharide deacetylase [Allostella vacuolata]|nr:polysaccharide deacetylase [Stella vacuolata]
MTATILLTVNVHGVGPESVDTPEAELFGRFAHGRYTYRIGLARLLDLLAEMGVRATFFWPVFEAERARPLLERCLAEGHEVGNHGNAFENHEKLGDREADVLERAHARLTELCGAAPVGFRAPFYRLSYATLPLLDRLGYLYDASFVDDDAPYLLAADGAPRMVELPWSEDLRDASHFERRLTQARAEAFMTEEIDALVPEAGYACITLHPRADNGFGRAARIAMLRRFLSRAQARFGAEFLLCRDLAAGVRAAGGWRKPVPALVHSV